jgi:hypothetical protein
MTQNGPGREYFGEFCFSCDPADGDSIRRAVYAALAAPRQLALAARIRGLFRWERAARVLAEAYAEVLEQQPVSATAANRRELMDLTDALAALWDLKEEHYALLSRRAAEQEAWTRELLSILAVRESERKRLLQFPPVQLARRLWRRV